MEQAERKRLTRNAFKVLERLRQGIATNIELCTQELGGLRAIGRIHDLRLHGHVIESRHVKGGLWEYELKAEAT